MSQPWHCWHFELDNLLVRDCLGVVGRWTAGLVSTHKMQAAAPAVKTKNIAGFCRKSTGGNKLPPFENHWSEAIFVKIPFPNLPEAYIFFLWKSPSKDFKYIYIPLGFPQQCSKEQSLKSDCLNRDQICQWLVLKCWAVQFLCWKWVFFKLCCLSIERRLRSHLCSMLRMYRPELCPSPTGSGWKRTLWTWDPPLGTVLSEHHGLELLSFCVCIWVFLFLFWQ